MRLSDIAAQAQHSLNAKIKAEILKLIDDDPQLDRLSSDDRGQIMVDGRAAMRLGPQRVEIEQSEDGQPAINIHLVQEIERLQATEG